MVALHITAAFAMAPYPSGSNGDVLREISQMRQSSMVLHDAGLICGVVPHVPRYEVDSKMVSGYSRWILKVYPCAASAFW